MSEPTTLLLDLDGPVLDVSPRYHAVHAEIVRAAGGAMRLDRVAYWEKKREGASIDELLRREGVQLSRDAYLARWLDRIEADDALVHDEVHDGARAAVERLAAHGPIALVTLRHDRPALLRELSRLGLAALFAHVLSASPRGASGPDEKARLVREAGLADRARWLVGDTEIDIRAARLLGVRAAAVTSGIRNERALRKEQPELLGGSLAALEAALY